MLSDAPFTSDHIVFVGLRITRMQWVIAQCLYVFISCVTYQVVMLAFSAALIMSNGYVGNVWSTTLFRIATDEKFGMIYSLTFPYSKFMAHNTPNQALMLSFVLQVGYGCVLAMVMFVLNLIFRRGVGIASALLWVPVFAAYTDHIVAQKKRSMGEH